MNEPNIFFNIVKHLDTRSDVDNLCKSSKIFIHCKDYDNPNWRKLADDKFGEDLVYTNKEQYLMLLDKSNTIEELISGITDDEFGFGYHYGNLNEKQMTLLFKMFGNKADDILHTENVEVTQITFNPNKRRITLDFVKDRDEEDIDSKDFTFSRKEIIRFLLSLELLLLYDIDGVPLITL